MHSYQDVPHADARHRDRCGVVGAGLVACMWATCGRARTEAQPGLLRSGSLAANPCPVRALGQTSVRTAQRTTRGPMSRKQQRASKPSALAHLHIACFADYSARGTHDVTFFTCRKTGQSSRGCLGFSCSTVERALARMDTACCGEHIINDTRLTRILLASLPSEPPRKRSKKRPISRSRANPVMSTG